jgi:hypothetical protein
LTPHSSFFTTDNSQQLFHSSQLNQMHPNDVYAVEFYWLSKAKSYACDSLKTVHKNRQEEIKFIFNVAKCDKIFYELHKAGCIKMSHTIPPLDELKWKAYCM